MGNKVLIIGLDGGTLDLLKPLVSAGIMPNLSVFFKQGMAGKLESVFPPMTGPGWVSFMTGKNPGKHAVFDFFEHTGSLHERKLTSFNSIRSETLWSLAGRLGKKVGVFNIPITYPPPQVDGFLVSGMLTPGMDRDFTYPASLKKELEKKFGRFVFDVPWQKYGNNSIKNFIEAISLSTRQKGIYTTYLMKRFKCDVFAMVFNDTDSIQHALWTTLTNHNDNNKFREFALGYYRELDSALGEILKHTEEDTYVFIISDHGFGPLDKRIHLNAWLYKEGFVSINWKQYELNRLLRFIRSPAISLITKTGINLKISRTRKSLGSRLYRDSLLHCINWPQTKAFSGLRTEQGIYINLAGRQKSGTVNAGKEYEELRSDIISKLQHFMDNDCKYAFPTLIRKREEVFNGPFLELAPDIVFLLQDGRCQADDIIAKNIFEYNQWRMGPGTHRMQGVLLAKGPGIRKGKIINDARIIDLLPTVLHILGLPIPDDLDGRVLKHLYTNSFITSNREEFMNSKKEVFPENTSLYSEDEEKEVVERLKGLGYLD